MRVSLCKDAQATQHLAISIQQARQSDGAMTVPNLCLPYSLMLRMLHDLTQDLHMIMIPLAPIAHYVASQPTVVPARVGPPGAGLHSQVAATRHRELINTGVQPISAHLEVESRVHATVMGGLSPDFGASSTIQLVRPLLVLLTGPPAMPAQTKPSGRFGAQ